jgi:hypothetical protein
MDPTFLWEFIVVHYSPVLLVINPLVSGISSVVTRDLSIANKNKFWSLTYKFP